MKKFLLIIGFLFLYGNAWGATYYLSNSGDGTTPTVADADHCWDLADLAGAGGTLAAGDTIIAMYAGGTITGRLNLPAVDGTLGNEITITIDQAGTASVPNFRASSGDDRAINLNNRSYYVLKGIDDDNKMVVDGNGELRAVTVANGTGCQIQYVDMFNVSDAVLRGDSQANTLIDHCHLHQSDSDGIYYNGGSFKIQNSTIDDVNNGGSLGDCIQTAAPSVQYDGGAYSYIIDNCLLERDNTVKNIVLLHSTYSVSVTNTTFTGPGADVGYCGGVVLSSAGYYIAHNSITDSERGLSLYQTSSSGTVHNNIIDDCDISIYIDEEAEGTLSAYNNTISGATNLQIHASSTISVNYKNNISVATTEHIDNGNGNLTSDYNDFYPSGTDFFTDEGTGYSTLVAWQSASAQDANSLDDDPQLDSNYRPGVSTMLSGGTYIDGVHNTLNGQKDANGDTIFPVVGQIPIGAVGKVFTGSGFVSQNGSIGIFPTAGADGADAEGDLISTNNLSELTDPAAARDNLELGADDDVEFGEVTMGSASVAIPATGVITTAMSKHGVLNDSALTAATDVQLLDIESATVFWIEIQGGDYGISLVPPSGEKIMRYSTLQTANYELDLSSNEGDIFTVRRLYSGSESDWVWQVIANIGTIADGGAAD
jgi:hypothetical protein